MRRRARGSLAEAQVSSYSAPKRCGPRRAGRCQRTCAIEVAPDELGEPRARAVAAALERARMRERASSRIDTVPKRRCTDRSRRGRRSPGKSRVDVVRVDAIAKVRRRARAPPSMPGTTPGLRAGSVAANPSASSDGTGACAGGRARAIARLSRRRYERRCAGVSASQPRVPVRREHRVRAGRTASSDLVALEDHLVLEVVIGNAVLRERRARRRDRARSPRLVVAIGEHRIDAELARQRRNRFARLAVAHDQSAARRASAASSSRDASRG